MRRRGDDGRGDEPTRFFPRAGGAGNWWLILLLPGGEALGSLSPLVQYFVFFVLALLVIWFVALWLAQGRPDRRSGFELGPAGLTVLSGRGRRRTVAWEQLQGVRQNFEGATIHCDDGGLTIDRDIVRWWELAQAVRDGLRARGLEARPAELTAAEVGAWLGLAPGERLVCRPRFAWYAPLLAPLLGGLALAAWRWLRLPFGWALPCGALSVAMLASTPLVWLWLVTQRLKVVTADATSLRYRRGGRWVECDWADVLAVRLVPELAPTWLGRLVQGQCEADQECDVLTERGNFRFLAHAPNGERVRHALAQAVEARRSGQLLPRLSEVPLGAVSRADSMASVERGLSLGQGE